MAPVVYGKMNIVPIGPFQNSIAKLSVPEQRSVSTSPSWRRQLSASWNGPSLVPGWGSNPEHALDLNAGSNDINLFAPNEAYNLLILNYLEY